MLKLITYFLFIIAIFLISAKLSHYNGSVEITWLGYQIETSLIFLLFTTLLVLFAGMLVYNILAFIFGFPSYFSRKIEKRNQNKLFENLQTAYTALLSGDYKASAKYADKIKLNKLTDKNLIIMKEVLDSSIAKSEGNLIIAEKNYKKLIDDNSTKFFATQGLLNSSFLRGDLTRAIEYAEDSYHLKPDVKDGAHSLLELYKKAEAWDKAEEFLKKYKRRFFFSSDKYNSFSANQELANIYLRKAENIKKNKLFSDESIEETYKLLVKSLDLYPENTECLIYFAHICKLLKKENKARSAIEDAWINIPSEALAEAYISLIIIKNDYDGYKAKVKALDKLRKINPESRHFLQNLELSSGS